MKTEIFWRCVPLILVWSVFAFTGFAHSGGLDSKGGHYNRKTGEYHFHRAPSQAAPRAPLSSASVPTVEAKGVSTVRPATAPAERIDRAAASKFEEIKREADAGNPNAQYQLGRMYFNGDGVEKSLPLAKKWFKASAAGGNKWSQRRLLEMTDVVEFTSTNTPLALETAATNIISVPKQLEQGSGKEELKFWLTVSAGKRHNSTCRYFRGSTGRHCGAEVGVACKICGG